MTEYINFLSKHLKSVEDYEISCWRKSHCDPKNIKIQELETIKRFTPIHSSLQKLTPNDLSYETSIEKHHEYSEKLEKITYCKPWKKLSQYHQREKIKEYICSLKYGKTISVQKKTDNRNYLISQLKDLTEKNIEYNVSEGKILNINLLKMVNGVYQFKE
jgi:hypothetical protein